MLHDFRDEMTMYPAVPPALAESCPLNYSTYEIRVVAQLTTLPKRALSR